MNSVIITIEYAIIRLNECKKFYMSVAFINFSGLQLLLDTFKDLEEKGIRGKIMTSIYLNFTEPKALKHIYIGKENIIYLHYRRN